MGMAVLVAVAAGAMIALQAAIIAEFSNAARPLAISLALLIAGLVVGSGWATARGGWPEVGATITQWWWIPLGVLGWTIVGALGWTASRLGVAAALTIIISAQLITALAIDVRQGTVALTPRPIIGLAVVLAGIVLLNRH